MRSGGRHTAGQKGQKPRHRQIRAVLQGHPAFVNQGEPMTNWFPSGSAKIAAVPQSAFCGS